MITMATVLTKTEEKLKMLYKECRSVFAGCETVMGEGSVNAELMLIGEAPGKDEVKESRPFVGAAGKNLDIFISMLGITRAGIYITNAIKYRLSELNAKSGRIRNRPATWEEVERSREYLLREIGLIRPKVIVTLGNVPLRAISGDRKMVIGKEHGVPGEMKYELTDYITFPLYHPASLIYNRDLKPVYDIDIIKLKKMLASKNIL